MLILRRRYVAGSILAILLRATCGLNLLGMYDARAVVAGITPITRGYTGSPNASLMFNVDWGEEYLPQILDTLKERGVPATFFLTGTWAERNATLVARMAREGHEVGNHGAAHSHVESMSRENLQRLIQSGEERIFQASGVRPAKLFAPPYGEWSGEMVTYVAESGYQTILWTVDTVDWRLPAPEAIWKRALAGAAPGALILLHPTEPTVSALPFIVDGLREKGLTLTTVSENITGKPR